MTEGSELIEVQLENDSEMLESVTKEDYTCFMTIIEGSDLSQSDRMSLEALFNKQIVSMYKLGLLKGMGIDIDQ
ncbi:hypothetical protein BK126_02875 [Paenibacillus sp. FSL H7-0326]|uniref:hypothetical protein n=1 Tax=Paenibacillus sp. FSL H7-0326 TaxID=1921144 RepID=UPI00096D8735|nr:hypothetical protein [Paenibacillus sp. FSL H7-0326]OMC71072.1 hypothetical protein BK126_02875 [Paenibacillus sp. FSL H7-0326]